MLLHAAVQASVSTESEEEAESVSVSVNTAACTQTLKQQGSTLFLTPLLKAKKYRLYGNKQGALGAWEELERAGLGKVVSKEVKGSGMVSSLLIL